MIHLTVELQDLTGDGSDKVITLPCNLRTVLNPQFEYVIVSCWPEISLSRYDDVERLNDILEEINSENPDMTAEYLGILLDASGMDIFDATFIRKASSNDFMFEDLSDIEDENMTWEEIAARYLTTELRVPFGGLGTESIKLLGDTKIANYVDWSEVWGQYVDIGFTIVYGTASDEDSIFLVYWRK